MKKNTTAVLLIITLFVLISVVFGIKSTNSLKMMDEEVNKQWSQVENVYQRRMDLIQNLVNTVKGYAEYEQETLTAVIEARAKATSVNIDAGNISPEAMQQFQATQSGLSSALSKLMVVVEKYPDLKANQNFLQLQSQLEGTENRIATERRRFNETVGNLNKTIRIFPYSVFANMAGLDARPYFEADSAASVAPEVNF